MKRFTLSVLVLLQTSFAMADVQGEVHPFTSPAGLVERCVRLDKIPGGVFSKKDDKSELEMCGYDIYRQEVAVCPKEWSTSPGTILYSTEGTGLSQVDFETQRCSPSLKDKNTKLTKFKNTMNKPGTSGTYAQSSLVYYQMSRLFDTTVDVPVAVYRSFDKDQHLKRVSSRATGQGSMNITGWQVERTAEQNPASYAPTRDLFTSDLKQIYGVLIDDGGGTRYGAEVNGIRSAWGIPQSNDFQNTPGFTALRSTLPFAAAVAAGVAVSHSSTKMANDVGSLPITNVQMGIWMKELTEITLLDFIFSQQDRIGNIDFYWGWVYINQGHWDVSKEKRPEFKDLTRAKMKEMAPPPELAALKPTLVQFGKISDNDAGVLTQYANFTMKTQMLEKIRHYDLETFRKLISLNADFKTQGPVFVYLRDKTDITTPQLQLIVKNTALAAAILEGTCQSGRMRFDLDMDHLVSGEVTEQAVSDCSHP